MIITEIVAIFIVCNSGSRRFFLSRIHGERLRSHRKCVCLHLLSAMSIYIGTHAQAKQRGRKTLPLKQHTSTLILVGNMDSKERVSQNGVHISVASLLRHWVSALSSSCSAMTHMMSARSTNHAC